MSNTCRPVRNVIATLTITPAKGVLAECQTPEEEKRTLEVWAASLKTTLNWNARKEIEDMELEVSDETYCSNCNSPWEPFSDDEGAICSYCDTPVETDNEGNTNV